MEWLALFIGVVVGIAGTLWLLSDGSISERQQALAAELEALRAAYRLQLMAWQTRQAMRKTLHDGHDTDGRGEL